MIQKKSLVVHVHRYDPNRKPPDYVQTYQVPNHQRMTVLETLEEIQHNQDSSLAFRSSCRSSKCGTCAVNMNGKPVLACRTMIEEDEITLAPLPRHRVIKDLIVDQQSRQERLEELTLQKVQIAAQLPESKIDYRNISRCIECTICTASCPAGLFTEGEAPTPDLLTSTVGAGIRVSEGDISALPLQANIDYCSLCLNCYIACPAGVDLNRLNAQGKDAYTNAQNPRLRTWLFGRPDLLGKAGSLVPKLSNLTLENVLVRKSMQAVVGISKDADMPPYESPFKRWFDRYPQRSNPSARRKVAFFVGCFNSYSDTQPAKDAVMLLDQLGVYVVIPEQQCCGMPMLANGDFEGARRRAEANLSSLKPWLDQCYDVISTCTTGSLMLKGEYTETLKVDDAEDLANRSYDLGEYLQLLVEEGLLDLGKFKAIPTRMGYHTPCHLKAQRIGRPFATLINQIPGMHLEALDTICCGLSGSYGLKSEKYEGGMDIGQHLFDALKESNAELAVSECGPCQIQMKHGTGLPIKHPVSILLEAFEGSIKP